MRAWFSKSGCYADLFDAYEGSGGRLSYVEIPEEDGKDMGPLYRGPKYSPDEMEILYTVEMSDLLRDFPDVPEETFTHVKTLRNLGMRA